MAQKKHNTRKLLLKGKSKKDIKQLVLEKVAAPPQATTVPPFTAFLHLRRSLLIITVPLHRIPEKIIQFDANSERFLLDTSKFARKSFHLEFQYPEGIGIDASSAEAKIQNGLFIATLPLVSVPPAFQLTQKEEGEEKTDSNRSRKRKRQEAKRSNETSSSSSAPEMGKEQKQSTKKARGRKKKQKRNERESDSNGTASSSGEKQIDVRAVDVNQALGLIDEVNSKEESKISEKLQREKEKIAAFKAKQKEKRQKKEKKKEKIEQLVEELKKEQEVVERDKKPLKKATPRRVSFGKGNNNGREKNAVPKKLQSALKKSAVDK